MEQVATAAYWQPGELEQVRICPCCGSSDSAERYRALHDHLEGVPGEWGFRRCQVCASLFLDPRPTSMAVGKAYASNTYFTHVSGTVAHAQDSGGSFGWRLANGYLNARYSCSRQPASAVGRWLVPLVPPIRQQLDYFYRSLPRTPGALLDVGCGNGAFLLRAAEAGWKVQGVEPDPLAADSAAACGLPIHRGDLSGFVPDREFDVITLSHVFEHLHNPSQVLSSCRELLKPGGRLWMSMPNVQGIGHRVYREAWFPLDPPRHLFLPSATQLVRMCQEAGFVQVRLLRRGRSGARGMQECAARAVRLGLVRRPAAHWRHLIDALSTLSSRASEELLLLAKKARP